VIPGENPPKVFLGHEMGHPYQIRDDRVIPFVEWVKEGYADVFKPQDWLFVGHCHKAALSVPSRVGCVGQFSPEEPARGYGVLTIGTEVTLELKDENGSLTAQL
jgi:hypothetical protein